MSIILFFGLAAFILIVGFAFAGLVIHHHWQKGRLEKKTKPSTP